MRLSRQDGELFFKLHRALMFFGNQRLKVIPNDAASAECMQRDQSELRSVSVASR
jgi:hypothetical protein